LLLPRHHLLEAHHVQPFLPRYLSPSLLFALAGGGGRRRSFFGRGKEAVVAAVLLLLYKEEGEEGRREGAKEG